MEDAAARVRKSYWWLPVSGGGLLIGISGGGREEISPLCDVLFAFLSSDLDLLLFATTSKVVLLQATLVLVVYKRTRRLMSKFGEREDVLALRCSIVRDSICEDEGVERRRDLQVASLQTSVQIIALSATPCHNP